VARALEQVARRGEVPLAFLYGGGDPSAPAWSRRLLGRKAARDLRGLTVEAIPGANAAGQALAGDEPARQAVRVAVRDLTWGTGARPYAARNLEKTAYYWLGARARRFPAKSSGEATPELLPLGELGLR
jgi:hypothetical protein